MADAQPCTETAAKVATPAELDRTRAEGLGEREVAEVDTDHRLEIGLDDETDVVAGVAEAQLDVGLVEHEPERLLLLHPRRPLALAPKLEAHEDALVRQLLRIDTPPEEPHEEPGVEGVRPKLMRRPLVAPRPEREDDRPQLFARGRGVVVEAAFVRAFVAL